MSSDPAAMAKGGKDIAILVCGVGKSYHIYRKLQDRMRHLFLAGLHRLTGLPARDYHREFWVLKNVPVEVRRGETMRRAGRNGAGKSTSPQLACGTLAPSSGTLETNGRIAALLELGSGFSPEFTGHENVDLSGNDDAN